MAEPSVYSQYLLELVNRARLSPANEASLYKIDLNQGLQPGSISNAPKQPLAFNPLLIDAANGHSQWMLDTDTFSHAGAQGKRAGDRILDAGYSFSTWGENIGYTGTTGTLNPERAVEQIHQTLFESSGHRRNLLKENFREVGLSTLTGDFTGYNAMMGTQDFATAANSAIFLTGVVFNDEVNDNDFYTIGEGLGDIAIAAKDQSNGKIFSTDTTYTGGYQLALDPGNYDVTFTINGQSYSNEIAIEQSNIKLDLNTESLLDLDGNNLLFGTKNNDSLQGQEGNDTIYGDNGNDTLEGNQNDDYLYGGWGDDVVFGGGGNDFIYLGIDNDYAAGDDGNDYIRGEWGSDFIYGGRGNDTLEGNQNNDRLYGNQGDDVVFGGSGNDFLYLGIDNDLGVGDDGNDYIQGEWGNDTLYGGKGNDTLEGNQNSDRLYGGWGDDVVKGGSGNDFLYLGIDNDFGVGDDGNDYIQGEWGDDTLYGGKGNDTLEGNQNSDRLYGGWGDDVVKGGNGNDFLYLGIDNDYAEGGSGNDYIQGEWGNDTLVGGTGADTLQGNQNNDTFYFNVGDSVIGRSDTIADFTAGSDKLSFNFSFASTIGSVSSLSQANAYFDGSSNFAFSATESMLYVDSTAQGVADMAIKLNNVTILNQADFI